MYATAYWTLNQGENALKAFLPLCRKYVCYTDNADSAADANFSTPGWNGMLKENFSPAFDRAVQRATAEFNDDITRDGSKNDELASVISKYFNEEIRKTTGSNLDLFCGSGSSVWDDVHKNFSCAGVRFTIDQQIQPTNGTLKKQNDDAAALAANEANAQKEIDSAKRRYGVNSYGYWLGQQDTIKVCKESGATCIVNLGGGNGPVVNVPQPSTP